MKNHNITYIFKTQIKIDSKYLFKFRFLLINVYLEENYRIFIALSSTFLATMPTNVNSFKFNIFMIRAFWEPKMKLVVPKRLRIDRRLSSYKQIIFSSEPLKYPI